MMKGKRFILKRLLAVWLLPGFLSCFLSCFLPVPLSVPLPSFPLTFPLMGETETTLSFIPPSMPENRFKNVPGSGARAFGMGGAFIAIADDATATSWNPGGLGQLENSEYCFVFLQQGFRTKQAARSESELFTGPHIIDANAYGFDFIAFTYPFRINSLKLVPQFSFQRGINFTLDREVDGVVFNDRQFDMSLGDMREYDGEFSSENIFGGGFDTISLSIATRLWDRFHIGVSGNFWVNGFEGEQTQTVEGTTSVPGSADSAFRSDYLRKTAMDIRGTNFNVGVLVDIFENLKVGAVYKSAFRARINYEISETREDLVGGVSLGSEEFDGEGNTSFKWPATWGVGISYRPIDTLTLSVDYTSTNWSQSILNDFSIGGRDVDIYLPSFSVKEDGKAGQLDTAQLRIGVEYVLIGEKLFIPLRGGFFTDSQYSPSAGGEMLTFYGATVGFGLKTGPVAVDFAALYEFGSYLDSNRDFSFTRFSEFRFYISTIFSF